MRDSDCEVMSTERHVSDWIDRRWTMVIRPFNQHDATAWTADKEGGVAVAARQATGEGSCTKMHQKED